MLVLHACGEVRGRLATWVRLPVACAVAVLGCLLPEVELELEQQTRGELPGSGGTDLSAAGASSGNTSNGNGGVADEGMSPELPISDLPDGGMDASQQPQPDPCDGGVLEASSNTCYRVFAAPLPWEEAVSACQDWGGLLVGIESPLEHDFVAALSDTDIWLGVNDRAAEGTFVGTDGAPVVFFNWSEGQPDDFLGEEDCVALRSLDLLWNDTSCTAEKAYVCERACSGACGDPCSDDAKNADEGDVDCGGRCGATCTDGQSCAIGSDCQSGVCTGAGCGPEITLCCQPPSCSDNQTNGAETGVDCGGIDCPRCQDGAACTQSTDCSSSNCFDGICISCGDSTTNGTETDIDCGGSDPFCIRCAAGSICLIDSDCESNSCSGGRC
jgi:hypothetical protein